MRIDFYDRINTSFKVKGVGIKHKLLYTTLWALMETWYTNKYNINCFASEWLCNMQLQQPLDRQIHRKAVGLPLFPQDNRYW